MIMIKKALIIVIIIANTLIITSCCKRVKCTQGYIPLAFVGFDQNDMKSFYIRRYKQNSSFTIKIDSVTFRQEELLFKFSQDTVFVTVHESLLSKDKYFTQGGYDYEIVIPATSQVFSLTELLETNQEEKVCGMSRAVCNTIIRSAKVNGINYQLNAVIKR